MLIENRRYFIKDWNTKKYLNIDPHGNLTFSEEGLGVYVLPSMYSETKKTKHEEVLINKVNSNLVLAQNENSEIIWSPTVSKFFENLNRFQIIYVDSQRNIVFLLYHGNPVVYNSNLDALEVLNKSLENCVEDGDNVIFEFENVSKEGYMKMSSMDNAMNVATFLLGIFIVLFILLALLAKLKILYKSSRLTLS